MDRKIFKTRVNREAEEQAENADQNAPQEKFVAINTSAGAAEEMNRGKVGKFEASFAARFAFELAG